jgi:xylulokinase
MSVFAGIDVGTSGLKAVLVGDDGRVIGQALEEYPLSAPHPGWSEQEPEHWWKAAQSTLDQLTRAHGAQPDAIGLTGQMHGAVFLDEKGDVIRPAMLWNDQRTARECATIDETVGAERLRAITRNPPLTGFQLPKVLWLRTNEPDAFARVRQVLLPKDYIRYRLTGEYATEVSDASGTGAFDIASRNWSRRRSCAFSARGRVV